MSDRIRTGLCAILSVLCVGCCVFGTVHAGKNSGTLTVVASGRETESVRADAPDGLIDINSADEEELTGFSGIGETIASRIVEEREKNGPFHYPEDLLAVSGIGENKLNGMLPLLLIPDGEEEE